MPNPWKKPPQPSAGLSRLVSGLRQDGVGGSSLVVQTGFPTSLADLVVKNCDRLRKPSRRKKRSSDLSSSASDAAAASPVSDFRPSPSPREDRRSRPCAPAVSVNSALQGADCVRCHAPAAAGPTERRGLRLFWLGLFMAKLFVLAVPPIDRRKLAAAVTLAAFGLWILDNIGVRVFRFLPPCANATRSSELASGCMDLERRALVSPIRELGNEGLVSPIRKVGNEGRSFSCSVVASDGSSSDLTQASEQSESSSNLIGESERGKSCPDSSKESTRRAADSVDLNQEKKVSWKRRDLGALAKVCAARLVGSSRNSKAKKLFGKLLPKKHQRKSNGTDVNAFALDLSSREISNSIIEQQEEAIESGGIATASIDDAMSFIASDSASNCDVENVEVVQERVCGARCINSLHLACLAVILLGLLGGKTLALVLTVILFLFGKSTESLWKKKMDSVV